MAATEGRLPCCRSLIYYLFSASFSISSCFLRYLYQSVLPGTVHGKWGQKKIKLNFIFKEGDDKGMSVLHGICCEPHVWGGTIHTSRRCFGPAQAGSLQRIPQLPTEPGSPRWKWQGFHPLTLGNAAKVSQLLLLGRFSNCASILNVRLHRFIPLVSDTS